MIRRLAVPVIAFAAAVGAFAQGVAAADEVISIELVGSAETRFVVDDRPYAGPMVVTVHREGLSLAERASIEQYLQGIAEMPLW